MSAPAQGPDSRTLLLFTLAVVLGGSNFLAVRLSNLALPPFWGAGLRFTLAALGFSALMSVLRVPPPRGRALWQMAGYGVLGYRRLLRAPVLGPPHRDGGRRHRGPGPRAAGHGAARGSAGLGATAAAERGIGGLVAVAGIAWLTLEPGHGSLPLGALLALLAAVACVSQSVIVAKRLQRHHPAAINAVALFTGAAVLLALSAAVGERWSLPQRPEAAWALVYLVTLGSIGLFLVLLTVVRRWTASATSYLFVLFPIATMVLEALLLAEPITFAMAGGALVVMFGVWLGAFAPARAVATPDTPSGSG
jgi:drug/metabolite transporter (DMT)-like permease